MPGLFPILCKFSGISGRREASSFPPGYATDICMSIFSQRRNRKGALSGVCIFKTIYLGYKKFSDLFNIQKWNQAKPYEVITVMKSRHQAAKVPAKYFGLTL